VPDARTLFDQDQTTTLSGLAFSPDGTWILTNTGEVILWDATSGTSRRMLARVGGSVVAIAFSPDGRTLAGGTGNGRVLLWDPASGRLIGLARRSGSLGLLSPRRHR